MPFVTLTTFMNRQRIPWFYLDAAMSAGFFGLCYLAFPGQCASRLLSGGLAGKVLGLVPAADSVRYVWQFLQLIPYCIQLIPAVFASCLFIGVMFKMPVKGVSLADRLGSGSQYDRLPVKTLFYGVFAAGFGLCWLAPSLLEWLNALAVI